MTTRARVVVAGTLPAAGLDLLGRRFAVEAGGDRPDAGWLREHARGAAAIVAGPSIPVDSDLLDAAGASLKVVSNFGVGHDNIDLDAARARGVRATNTPNVLSNATAELAVALMLAAGRRIAEGDALVRRLEWTGWGPEEFLGRELAGATVGLVGFGRIARRVAELLRGFEVRLLFTSRSVPAAPAGAERRELPDLLAAADVVSLHVPLTPQTRHLIDGEALATMKPGAILVNTSRGAVVDTAALVEALRSGRLAAAGLDVYEDEPSVPSALRELPNTVLLPHVGSATRSTRDAMARLCAENVIAVIDGREPPAAVV
jgi:lactate dehydrogenase-like 2-hydroxyacid dehydrogenase